MRRLLIVFYLILYISVDMLALKPYRMPKEGYRGFLEVGASGGMREIGASDGIGAREYYYTHDGIIFISTTHGYQFNENFFLGGGFILGFGVEGEFPVYIDGRYDFKFNKITPFADLRIGYNLWKEGHAGGFWFSPTIGYRFNWGRKAGFNIGVGFSFKEMDVPVLQTVIGIPDYPLYDPDMGDEVPLKEYLTKVGSKVRFEPYWTVRIGFDF